MEHAEKVALGRYNYIRMYAVNAMKHISVLRSKINDNDMLQILSFIDDELANIIRKVDEAEFSLLELSEDEV
jgi:hypothetical protein